MSPNLSWVLVLVILKFFIVLSINTKTGYDSFLPLLLNHFLGAIKLQCIINTFSLEVCKLISLKPFDKRGFFCWSGLRKYKNFFFIFYVIWNLCTQNYKHSSTFILKVGYSLLVVWWCHTVQIFSFVQLYKYHNDYVMYIKVNLIELYIR